MRTALFAAAAAVGTAAIAQVQPAPPPSAGPPTDLPTDNRGMGAVTDIPNQYSDPRTAAEDALARRGDARPTLAQGGRTKEQRQALAYRAAIERYVAATGKDRLDALAAADATRSAAPPDADAGTIRSAFEKDLAAWGKAFGFDRPTMADQRAQWLAETESMTAADWARRRADWFAARDAWVAQQQALTDQQAAAPN